VLPYVLGLIRLFYLCHLFIFSPLLLWKYGKKIRMSSKNAHKAHAAGAAVAANALGAGRTPHCA